MKTCTKCGVEKLYTEFRKDRTQRSGLYPQCKQCKKEEYDTSSDAVVATRRKHQQAKRDARASITTARKLEAGCYICGENGCAASLDFHHRSPVDKDVTISEHRTMPLDKLMAEMDKCLVLCANCHRKVHADYVCIV